MKNREFTKEDMPKIKKRNWHRSNTVRIYHMGDGVFLFPSYTKDTHLKSPDALFKDIAELKPVGFTRYRGRFDSSITTYAGEADRAGLIRRITNAGKIPLILDFPYPINHSQDHLFEEHPFTSLELGDVVDATYSIQSIHTRLDGKLEMFINSIRHDIFTHMKGHVSKSPRVITKHYTEVPELNFEAEFKQKKPSRPDLVAKFGKGLWAGECSIDIGIDGSMGCVANLTPSGNYDVTGICSMCYAHQNRLSFLRTSFDLDPQYVKDAIVAKINETKLDKVKRPIYIRLGHSTEFIIPKKLQNIPGFVDNLDIILDAIIELKKEYNIRCVLPSHTVEYDPAYSRKFKQADLSLFASVDHDSLDKGIVRLGFPTEKRLEGLLQYANDGVNANIYLAVDFVRGVEAFQPEAWMAMKFREEHPNIGLQFLDLRITKLEDAMAIGGDTWQNLKSRGYPLFEDSMPQGGWKLTGQNYLAARNVHPSIKELIAKSRGKMRGCYVHADDPRSNICGNCFMEKVTSV